MQDSELEELETKRRGEFEIDYWVCREGLGVVRGWGVVVLFHLETDLIMQTASLAA